MTRLALIGVGRWGSNIKRTLTEMGVDVVTLEKGDQLDPVARALRGVEGVIVATPASTHAAIALPFIRHGQPVFIEKPLATSLREAQQLARAAQAKKGHSAPLVFVGHIHLYNPAYQKAKALIQAAGAVQAVWLEGMNWGPERRDISAWWDWAPHDLAMAVDLFGTPRAVQAWGNQDTAIARLEYSRRSVLIHVNWLSPEKRRKLVVVGSKYSVIFDDVAERKVATWSTAKISYHQYDTVPPLKNELMAFLHMIKTGHPPLTDLRQGIAVVRLLEAGEQSMHAHGRRVTLRR